MNWNNGENKAFVQALLALSGPDEARRFLRDLLTENEIKEFATRLQAATLLSDNVPYSIVEKKTGMSSTTIARVSKWLNGEEGGYRSVIGKIHHHSPSLAGGC